MHYGAVQDFLGTAAAQRIVLVRLPSYAPELNPVEGVWHYRKQVELVKVCCRTLAERRQERRTAIARVRQRGDGLAGCIRQPAWY
jgi:transposase